MKAKLKIVLLILLGIAFTAVTIALFLPSAPVLLLFPAYLVIVLAVLITGFAPAAFMLSGFVTLLGIYVSTRAPREEMGVVPLLVAVLWGCVALGLRHFKRIAGRSSQLKEEKDRRFAASQALNRDILFYESRAKELARRAEQRRLLSRAARELGSLLDPQAIQARLLQITQMLFPQKQVAISYGQQSDAVDSFVMQQRHSLQIPNNTIKGRPLIAAPIHARNAVAGVLKVAEANEAMEFTRDDLRLLEIMASLASLALDNSILFYQVKQTALRDGLTGLLTHRAFQEKLESEILEASRFGSALSILLCDLDHFKTVNDTYGHQAGDQVLQGYAHVLVRNVRDIDVVARYGGEEFIVLLPQIQHAEACAIAERMRLDISQQVFEGGSQSIAVTGSFGVASFPEDATTAPQLIRQADQRLYRAKEGGRNLVRGR